MRRPKRPGDHTYVRRGWASAYRRSRAASAFSQFSTQIFNFLSFLSIFNNFISLNFPFESFTFSKFSFHNFSPFIFLPIFYSDFQTFVFPKFLSFPPCLNFLLIFLCFQPSDLFDQDDSWRTLQYREMDITLFVVELPGYHHLIQQDILFGLMLRCKIKTLM